MAAIHIETERKYEGGAADTRLDPGGLPGVAGVVPAADEELDAVYYDTPDLRLLAHGATLRRRTGGHDAGWHLKRPAGGDSREELRLPVGRDDAVPDELLTRVKALARGEPLVPVLRMRTRREREHLVDARGKAVAEIAHDHVSAEILHGPDGRRTRRGGKGGKGGKGSKGKRRPSAPGRIVAWSELEVELESEQPAGKPSLLDAVEKQLSREGWRRSASSSKTAHVFATSADGRRRAAAAERRRERAPRPGTAGAVVHARLAEQVAALVAADPRVRLDDDEAVHDMRVATRRLRSLLRSYRPLFEHRVVDPVVTELKWLGGVLGNARDHEVLADRFASRTDELAAAHDLDGLPAVSSAVARAGAHMRDAESAAYRHEHTHAARQLDSRRYFRLVTALEAMAADPPLRPRAARKAPREVRRVVERDHRRLAARLRTARSAAPGPERDRALHEARKAAKRLRYAAETAAPVAGRSARRFVRRTKRVQRVLGEHQDAVVARSALARTAAGEHRAGADTFAYGLLFAAEQRAAARSEQELPRLWKRLKSPRAARIC
ncbi:CYTH and CHAD domain-containing protein [Yinghuangia sp. ASG 101]|uniref:CYTH and CHAD domain-containing protein n=1 Tax=Yinghuangia sp. ASG 101 TaxID=2896848 RepID=UPI001E447934|nr:CYTH and CHAD domain-containing protein [Yinghuangia sp. ASG 101]UGQ12975.1 CYTH and CHAD domain-containing protein [Yinghuangia sp. ASG 101]